MITRRAHLVDGRPSCLGCGFVRRSPELPPIFGAYVPGEFDRDGCVLTCKRCGEKCLEPTVVTLQRHEGELAALREIVRALAFLVSEGFPCHCPADNPHCTCSWCIELEEPERMAFRKARNLVGR